MSSTKSKFSKVIISISFILGAAIVFATGFALATLKLDEPSLPASTPIPIASPGPNSMSSDVFIPGKHYSDDTVIVITKDPPYKALVATAERHQQDSDYLQYTRVYFNDGTNWISSLASTVTTDLRIQTDNLIKSWQVDIDPSRVLRQSSNGLITINNSAVGFATSNLQNEIATRSLPGYTKFMSKGEGTLTIDGKPYQANLLYTRTFSQDASNMQFSNQPLGVTTDWLAFWTKDGAFYHIDATQADKPIPSYQTYELGIYEGPDTSIVKTFDLTLNRKEGSPPKSYNSQMHFPIQAILQYNLLNQINKDPDSSYDWFMGLVEGTVQHNGESIPGVGLVEYINN